jgi:hypothetical protein
LEIAENIFQLTVFQIFEVLLLFTKVGVNMSVSTNNIENILNWANGPF